MLAYRRRLDHDDVVVVLNPRNEQHDLRIPLPDATSATWRDELTDKPHPAVSGGLVIEHLPATSALILAPDRSTR